jgi:lyso-ornithine lipid O-acyltransferase
VSLRACRRAVALALALAACVVRYWLLRVRGPLTLEQRAFWMQSAGRVVMAALGIHCKILGNAPASGLVVCNHLSYLDIVILSAVMPCFFVSKVEIDRWPFFGKAARTGGTIFINRSSRASAAAVARQIAERLALQFPVLVFPEGTSSDGSTVLRFHTALFEPATAAGRQVTAAAVRYVLEGGREERDLCWFDDTLFLSHLWKALGTAGFFAEVRFGEPRVYPDRRTAARVTHQEVALMRAMHDQRDVSECGEPCIEAMMDVGPASPARGERR